MGLVYLANRSVGAVSLLGAAVGATCLAILVVGVNVEVALRYFFLQPTAVFSSVAPGLLCASILLPLPEITRRGRHVAMTILIDRLPAGMSAVSQSLLQIIAAFLCAIVAWVTFAETMRTFSMGITTIGTVPVPKGIILATLPFSFGVMCLQFVLNGLLISSGQASSERI